VGTVDFTDASKAYFFPVGVPGLFRQYNAPADFVETANTIGLRGTPGHLGRPTRRTSRPQ
jgi:hypothetical protein